MSTIHRLALVAAAVALCACDAKPQTPAPDGKGGSAAKPGPAHDMKHDVAHEGGAVDKARLLAAYDKGLDFLASKQQDGIWSVQGKPHAGFTAMSITPFIDRPGGVREKDKALVAKTLPWIASQLGDDGGVKAEFTSNYETSVVVMALAASKDPAYKDAVAKAAGYLKGLQYSDPQHPSYGGIGYGDDGPRSDLSNTQYALAALDAAGVPKDDPLYQKALAFLSRVQNRKENETPGEPTEFKDEQGNKVVRANDGGAVYYPGESKAGYETLPDGTKVQLSYGSMTYALLRCFHLAGLPATDGRVKAATDWIAKHWAVDRNPGMPETQKRDGYYYYLATLGKTLPLVGMDKIKTGDGKDVDWRAAVSAALLAEQKPEGMWMNPGPRWMESDPVLATGYALAALGACVR